MKRFADILASAFLLTVLLPVLLLVAVLILLFMGGPVFFIQPRPGREGKIFHLLKFRTMSNSAPDEGNLAGSNAYVTPLGQVLRRMSLDELPQLWNVLKGDMSLVGPRPLLVEYLPLYNPEQNRRHLVRPGITGWAQVNGRNALSWEEKFRLDVWYVEHQSLALDMKILLLTLGKVLHGGGVNRSAEVSAEKFSGTK